MRRRRLIGWLLLATPFVVLAAIAVGDRISPLAGAHAAIRAMHPGSAPVCVYFAYTSSDRHARKPRHTRGYLVLSRTATRMTGVIVTRTGDGPLGQHESALLLCYIAAFVVLTGAAGWRTLRTKSLLT